jgi:hypothetical protein
LNVQKPSCARRLTGIIDRLPDQHGMSPSCVLFAGKVAAGLSFEEGEERGLRGWRWGWPGGAAPWFE